MEKGFIYKYGMDYDEIFSLVSRMTSIHCLLLWLHKKVATVSNKCQKCFFKW